MIMASLTNTLSNPAFEGKVPYSSRKRSLFATALEIEAYKKEVLSTIVDVDSSITDLIRASSSANEAIEKFAITASEHASLIQENIGNVSSEKAKQLMANLQAAQVMSHEAATVAEILTPEVSIYIDSLKSVKSELERVYDFADIMCRSGFSEKFPNAKIQLTEKFNLEAVENIIYEASTSMNIPEQRMIAQLSVGSDNPLAALSNAFQKAEKAIYEKDAEAYRVYSNTINVDFANPRPK